MAAAERHGFHPRPFKHGIMFTPQKNKTRVLLFADVEPAGDRMVKLGVSPQAFQEFYGLRIDLVTKELGARGFRRMSASQVRKFVGRLDRLMSSVGQRSANRS
jgi:hypothetical protein